MKKPPVVLTPAQLKVQAKGTKLITPLQRDVEQLEIADAADYEAADILLGDIDKALQAWAGEIDPILSPQKEAIDAQKRAMEATQTLDKKVRVPLEDLRNKVRALMQDYKREEQRQIQAAAAKADELSQQAEETAAQAESAQTAALRRRLSARVEQLTTQATTAAAAAEPVKGAHSQARTVKAWRIAGTERAKTPETPAQMKVILQAVLAGKVPMEAISLNHITINAVHLKDRDSMATWPGFELFDDVVIAGWRG